MSDECISEKEKIEDTDKFKEKYKRLEEKIKDLKIALRIIEEKGDHCPHRICNGYYSLKESIEWDIKFHENILKGLL